MIDEEAEADRVVVMSMVMVVVVMVMVMVCYGYGHRGGACWRGTYHIIYDSIFPAACFGGKKFKIEIGNRLVDLAGRNSK